MLKPSVRYHVYNQGNNGETLYRRSKNYIDFLNLSRKYILPVAQVYAWCLMPNHYHFIVRIRTEEEQNEYFLRRQEQNEIEESMHFRVKNPSRAFSNAFSTFVMAVNKEYNRSGSLFRDTFRRREVLDTAYFNHLIHYTHHNPVKHGFLDDPLKYKWSSMAAFNSGCRDEYLDCSVTDCFKDVNEYMSELKNTEKKSLYSSILKIS